MSDSEDKPTVLILGASFGGLGTARQLVKNGGAKKFRIILLDIKDKFTIGGLWQFVWTDRLTMDQIMFSLNDVDLPGIELRFKTKVTEWDVAGKHVKLNGTSISYNHIVMACGIVPDPTPIPGIKDYINICTLDTVTRQRNELQEFMKEAKTGEKVTFVLAIGQVPYKCPPAPFEVTFLLEEALCNHKVRDNARLVITCPVDWPMPPPTKAAFQKELDNRNIEFLGSHVMDKIVNGTIHYSNGTTLEPTMLWTVYPICAPDILRKAIPVNDQGFVTVDHKVTHTIPNVENAHVIGDCCTVAFGEYVIPKAGEFAWKMGQSVADAIVTPDKVPKADRVGACVAEIGFGKGIALRNDFSQASNTAGEMPTFEAVPSEQGEEKKMEWVNSYLQEIFGEKARLLELPSKEDDEGSRKRQKTE